MAKVEQYALSNPISVLCDKERSDLTRKDILDVIRKQNIERVTFHYTGIDGKIKELVIPVFDRGQIEVILAEGERVDGSSLFKGLVETGKSDLYVVPVYKSAFLNPFDDKSLDFVCRFMNPEGELAEFPPDNILNRAHNLLKERTGLELHALGELEFFLLGNYDNKTFPMPKQMGYHASAPFVKGGAILHEMLRYITRITGNVKYAHNEVGLLERVTSDFEELNGKMAEQVEIEFLPTPIDETADIIVLARWIIRNVAYRNNFVATFSPKLEVGHAGNGMHVHTCLMKNGKNVTAAKSGELTEEARCLIGGLCNYAQSLTAFGNMVPGSYLRLVPHQEAPTRVCWSESNRSALIRVPLGWGNVDNLAAKVNPQQKEKFDKLNGRQTIELRSPDGSANAHMLLSGMTLAVEWGLTHKNEALELAEISHTSVNIHSATSELPELPTSCAESSENLLRDRQLYQRDDVFSSTLINFVANMLQNENDKNLNKRLMALPDDEKLRDSRRIMHRDIHKH